MGFGRGTCCWLRSPARRLWLDQGIFGTNRRPTDRPSVYSGRSFFFIAPEMCCPDIVWMIVSPGPSYPFGISMVWDNVAVVGELFVADGTLPASIPFCP